MTDALRLGWSVAEADNRRRVYRRVLLAVLIVQGLAGVAALFFPACVSDWLGLPAVPPEGWLRAVGAFLLITAVLYVPGYINPAFARYPNVVCIASRFGLAVLYACLGGPFRWLALYEAAAGIALGMTYQRFIGAELMSRP
jgi:hypothetical protein